MSISPPRTRPLPWLCGALVLACAAWAATGSTPADEGACGLGLPPGHPGSLNSAAQEAKRAAEVREHGFERVCEANLERYSISLFPMALARRGLAFEPVALDHTPFARLDSLGGRSETVGDTVSRFYRGFRTPEGHRLTLFEHDMSADGSRMWRDPEDEPERIGDLPARLVVLQAPSGDAVSVLSWLQGRRYIELWLEANAARDPLRRRLFELAASLPPAVPACPGEPPKRPVLGPDGFPLDGPTPEFLSPEEFDAPGGKRPCK